MLKTTSFVDAIDLYCSCREAVRLLTGVFGVARMETLNNALALYAQTPDWHSCDEDPDFCKLFCLALRQSGFSFLKPEFDVTQEFFSVPVDFLSIPAPAGDPVAKLELHIEKDEPLF